MTPIDLGKIGHKFGLDPYLVDRLHRRLRDGAHHRDVAHRVELLCLAVVTRNLAHTLTEWIGRERTPIDDAIDEANAHAPRWTRFDWDCDAEVMDQWVALPGDRVRAFTPRREFIGYARVVHWADPMSTRARVREYQFRFELPIPEWAKALVGVPNIGRVLRA